MIGPPSPIALVTGGASGIGRAFCLELARRGGRVMIADVDVDGANHTAHLVNTERLAARVVRCDVSDAAQFEAAFDECERAFGAVDLLVNNAGVGAGGRVGECALDDWAWVVGVNMWGAINGCHLAVPRMKRRRCGTIINVASAAGVASAPEMAAYNVTKAAVIALSETLFVELAGTGVGVTVLCPTFVQTYIIERGRMPEKRRELGRKLMQRAKITTQSVVRAALDGADRGALYVFPQADGRWAWRAKRASPDGYCRALRAAYRHGLFDEVGP